MRTIIAIGFGVLLCLSAAAVDASAQQRRGVNNRQANQRERISDGYHSGQLTAREAARLAREQAQVHRMEQRFRRSGDGLSQRERARLQYELSQSSWHIYRQRHDRQGSRRP